MLLSIFKNRQENANPVRLAFFIFHVSFQIQKLNQLTYYLVPEKDAYPVEDTFNEDPLSPIEILAPLSNFPT
jgi:hypothetical protein